MLIKTKSRETIAFGRLRVHVDDFARTVKIEAPIGMPATRDELRAVHKMLSYHRPTEFSEVVMTGWECSAVVQLSGV